MCNKPIKLRPMKKIIVLILAIFISYPLFSQDRKLSDYEKYRMEKEAMEYDTLDDEIFYDVEETPKFNGKDESNESQIIVNNYYNYDYDFGYRHKLYFDVWYYRPYGRYLNYNSWYGYDPYYDTYYNPYWGYNPYYNRYYGYNYHYPNRIRYYPKPHRGSYYISSSLGRTKHYGYSYYKTHKSGTVNSYTSTKKSPKRMVNTRSTVNRKNEPVRKVNKIKTTRNYTPKYTKPTTTTRPRYNNSRTEFTRPSSSSSSRSNYSRPSSSCHLHHQDQIILGHRQVQEEIIQKDMLVGVLEVKVRTENKQK